MGGPWPDSSAAPACRSLFLRLATMLRAEDPALAAHLFDENQVDPQFYALRWLMTCLAGDFHLPEVLRLWDAILAAPAGKRLDRLLRVCTCMHLAPLARARLMEADFAGSIKLLQAYPEEVPVEEIVALAAQLEDRDAARGR